jgi:hypothetical protein
MPINRKLLAPLCSGLLLSATAFGQLTAADCKGIQPTPTELLVQHDEPLCRYSVYAPSCERIPNLHADAVFIGTVIRLEKNAGRAMVNGECSNVSVETATVRTKESFTGPLPETVIIHSGTVNGYYFNHNETALIFANKNPDGTFSVSGCGGTKSMTEWYTHGPRENPQANEDIAYLRSRASLPPAGRIFGNVEVTLPESMSHMNPAFGFGNQHVILNGASSQQAITPRSGEFSFDNLPPGKYFIRIDSLKRVSPFPDSTVTVPPRGCAKVNFYIESAEDYRNILASFKKASSRQP